ncbi:MAG: hypothetical protein FWG53_02605, partial [Clostridiales bacterium]|nr:hypothetical protein [Clostridiales bacterium]
MRTMVSYYAICPMANCHAQSWWEGSYARILYPKANLTGQPGSDMGNVLIDSAGLPIYFRYCAGRRKAKTWTRG